MTIELKAALFSFVPGLVLVLAAFATNTFYAGDSAIFGEGPLSETMLAISSSVLSNALFVVLGVAAVVFVYMPIDHRRHPLKKW